MQKKITNPLRSGLPSKIYLAAYGKPISGYEIARRVYGIAPAPGKLAQIPPTAKVYGWLKKLEKDGLVKKLDEGYLSQAAPLINEIEKTLEVHTAKGLTTLEKKILIKILDSKEFRSCVGNRTNKIDLKEDVDAARELTDLLVMPSFALKALKMELENPKILALPEPTTLKKFDELWDNLPDILDGRAKELKEEVERVVRKGPAAGAAFYQAKKRESSLSRDIEVIKSRARGPEGMLALKFACVPAALSEEIENLSPMAVAVKGLLDRLRKRGQEPTKR
ncbi:MAG: hypothetical protein QMC89_06505 [Candidatus Hodarchaeaceae archaeon]|nr:hypothetical protein [Candidatus Hodarchaeaceae archaeon]